MQVFRAQQRSDFLLCLVTGSARAAVVLLGIEALQQAIEVLHIAYIAAEADDGFAVEGFEAVDVGEAGEGAVRGEVVGGDDDAVGVFERDDGGAGDDGGLGVRGGCAGATVVLGEVGGVVGAVDVVAGLC